MQRDFNLPAPPGLHGRRRAPWSRGRHSAGRERLGVISRVIAVGVLAGLGFTLIVFQYQVRHLEAGGAASLCSLVTPTTAAPGAPVVRFGLGTPDAFGLAITPDSSSLLLLAPLCGLGMILIAPGHRQVRRAGKALAVVSAVMMAGNLVRIGVIAVAIRMGGVATGYQVSNLVLGSLISVVCITLSLALLMFMLRSRDGRVGTRS